MTDKMREALIKFGDDNPSLDLDFRLHTHGKYLTQEKAIVASRAFKAGAAWQAAQSAAVPVVGDVDKMAESISGMVMEWVTAASAHNGDWQSGLARIIRKRIERFQPTTSIRADELERLRKDADKLQKDAERMQKALSDIAEWTDRYTTPGHPIANIARAAIAGEKNHG